MNNNFFISAFGTFGNPIGFNQSYLLSQEEILKEKVKTFDLNTDAITLFADNEPIYSIRKEYINKHLLIDYTIYTYAKIKGLNRGGSFIGSSILFIDKITDENIIIKCLNEFHKTLESKNIQNNEITVTDSKDFNIGEQLPVEFNKIKSHLREVNHLNFAQVTGKNLVVYCKTSPDKLETIFKKSILLLNEYDTIYFTQSENIAKFVQQKGVFFIIDQNGFEDEIQRVEAERLRKVQSTIDDFQRKINEVNTDKVRFSENHQSELQRLKKIHQENQEKINLFEKSKSFYEESYANFAQYIGNLINNLKLDGKIDVAQQNLRNATKIFNDAIARNKTPDFNAIHTAQIRSNIKEPVNQKPSINFGDPFNSPEQEDNPKKRLFPLDLYKVISIILATLLLCSLYFYFSGDSEEVNSQKIEEKHPEPVTNYQEDEQTTETHKQVSMTLSPKPTTQLNHNDLNIVNRKLTKEMMLDEVVALIFKENPTDISQWYQNQAESYGIELSKLNRNSFEEREGIYYYTGDSLIEIPSHQEQVP